MSLRPRFYAVEAISSLVGRSSWASFLDRRDACPTNSDCFATLAMTCLDDRSCPALLKADTWEVPLRIDC